MSVVKDLIINDLCQALNSVRFRTRMKTSPPQVKMCRLFRQGNIQLVASVAMVLPSLFDLQFVNVNHVISSYLDLLERHRLFTTCTRIREVQRHLDAQPLVVVYIGTLTVLHIS